VPHPGEKGNVENFGGKIWREFDSYEDMDVDMETL
jgi:hypothetical protein